MTTQIDGHTYAIPLSEINGIRKSFKLTFLIAGKEG